MSSVVLGVVRPGFLGAAAMAQVAGLQILEWPRSDATQGLCLLNVHYGTVVARHGRRPRGDTSRWVVW